MHQPRTTTKTAFAMLPQRNMANLTSMTQSQQMSLPARRDHDHVSTTEYKAASTTRTTTPINKSRLYLSSAIVYSTRKLTYTSVTCKNALDLNEASDDGVS